jgi:hypothetical protein
MWAMTTAQHYTALALSSLFLAIPCIFASRMVGTGLAMYPKMVLDNSVHIYPKPVLDNSVAVWMGFQGCHPPHTHPPPHPTHPSPSTPGQTAQAVFGKEAHPTDEQHSSLLELYGGAVILSLVTMAFALEVRRCACMSF